VAARSFNNDRSLHRTIGAVPTVELIAQTDEAQDRSWWRRRRGQATDGDCRLRIYAWFPKTEVHVSFFFPFFYGGGGKGYVACGEKERDAA
jgi:hypothetical protein